MIMKLTKYLRNLSFLPTRLVGDSTLDKNWGAKAKSFISIDSIFDCDGCKHHGEHVVHEILGMIGTDCAHHYFFTQEVRKKFILLLTDRVYYSYQLWLEHKRTELWNRHKLVTLWLS